MNGELQNPAGILVVDDKPDNLRLMAEVLQGEGYTVRVATGGEQALQSVQARLPDLILLDIKMPDLDGLEVCRRLKADPATRDVPVIFLSALREHEDKLRGFGAGGVDYITKPFIAEEVLARIRTHLALHNMHQELERQVFERTRALRTLSAGNQAVVHASDEGELIQQMCHAIVHEGGYLAARAELDESEIHHCSASEGSDHGGCQQWVNGMTPAEGPLLTPAANPLQGKPICKCGARFALELPIRDNGDILGRLLVFADKLESFSEAKNVSLLQEMAGDLGYGVVTLRARAEHLRNRERQERSFAQTIEALAATIEVRDPYTAGHQRRTTAIAEAIGRRMGLDEDRLKGLHIAGTIHDIGKISVPSSLLSKPGKLSDVEFAIIQLHPQTGYEILKGIEFPWPVADIVRQHHERQDGSGYPKGLHGKDILLEARILAVADMLEAISSHRPYRPALGIAFAIEELKKQSGSKLDSEVVACCVQLVEAGEFTDLSQ